MLSLSVLRKALLSVTLPHPESSGITRKWMENSATDLTPCLRVNNLCWASSCNRGWSNANRNSLMNEENGSEAMGQEQRLTWAHWRASPLRVLTIYVIWATSDEYLIGTWLEASLHCSRKPLNLFGSSEEFGWTDIRLRSVCGVCRWDWFRLVRRNWVLRNQGGELLSHGVNHFDELQYGS